MSVARGIDRLVTTFFGIATRRALRDYVAHVALMVFILMIIAWTIDLAGSFPGIRKDAAAREVPVWQITLPYLAYRAADILARTMPMACFFGVFLAEFRRRGRLETVIYAVGGASPVRLLAPVVLFGLMVGTLQHQLEARWRPAAVAAQVELGHGSYARRFAKRWTWHYPWFISGDTAVRAMVLRDDEPAMRDLLIFKGLRAGDLQQVYSANRAEPTGTPGEWRLSDAQLWDIAAGSDGYVALAETTIELDLIPEQLRYLDIPGFYLPDAPLRAIARMRDATRSAADADVAIWRRRTAWALPGVVALLAVVLAKSGYSGRRPNIPWLIGLALAGYIAVISIKVLWSVGELGALPGWLSVCGSLAYLLIASALILRRQL